MEALQSGDAHLAACGAAVTAHLEQGRSSVSQHPTAHDTELTKHSKDPTGPVENAVQYADADYDCNAYLCRGYQYGDNTDNVMAVKAGDSLRFHINLVASHKPGYANMSVVDAATNTVITALKTWDHWPDVTDGSTFDEKTKFNVTVPEGLESRCDEGGKCVMQWFWYAISNVQTYESCHDFYIVS
jgi:hypothetical protein